MNPESIKLDSKTKSPSYSPLGAMSDSALNTLRDQIKKTMIPLLIKIFQLRLDLNQSISLPSRLQPKSTESPESILAQLRSLDEDLKLLVLWCESSRNQIAKALNLSEEEALSIVKASMTSSLDASSDPFNKASKSFSSAFCTPIPPTDVEEEPSAPSLEKASPKKTKRFWWF